MEIEIKDNNWTWGHVQRWTQDKPTWGSLVTTSCTNQHKEDMVHYLSSFYQQLKQKMKIQVKFHVHTKTLKPNVFLTFNIFSKKKLIYTIDFKFKTHNTFLLQ